MVSYLSIKNQKEYEFHWKMHFDVDLTNSICIVITVLGRQPEGAPHCAMFQPFSIILPPLISFTS